MKQYNFTYKHTISDGLVIYNLYLNNRFCGAYVPEQGKPESIRLNIPLIPFEHFATLADLIELINDHNDNQS